MRSQDDGRDTLPPGCDPYAVNDIVYAVEDGAAGTVVSVGRGVVAIMWYDAPEFTVDYPPDTKAIRKPWPWES